DPSDPDRSRLPDLQVEPPDRDRVRGGGGLQVQVDAPPEIRLLRSVDEPVRVVPDEQLDPSPVRSFPEGRPRGLRPPSLVEANPVPDPRGPLTEIRLDPPVEVPDGVRRGKCRSFNPGPVLSSPADDCASPYCGRHGG